MARKTKRDWLEAGISTLDESGLTSLTIDELAGRLGVTKGSFYHHFDNYQDFQEQLLAFWEEESTLRVIQAGQEAGSIPEVFDRIVDLMLAQSQRPEVVIRAWALQDDLVRGYVERVDVRRLAYGQEAFQALTHDPEQALLMARMLYSILVGSDQLQPPIPVEARWQLYHEFKRLYNLGQGEA